MHFYVFIILIFSFTSFANDCNIETHKKVLILSQEGDFSQLIKKSDCNTETNASFVNFSRNARGIVKNQLLSKLFPNVQFNPEEIEFVTLQDLLDAKALLPKEGSIIKASKFSRSSIFGVDKDQRIEVECRSCPSAGHHSIKISHRDSLGQYLKTEWIKAEVGVAVRALVSKTTQIAKFAAIEPNTLISKTIISSNPQNIVSPSTPIQFYKFSKTLNSGETLKRDHISPLQLVRPGTQAKVLIKDGSITINGFAEPLSYGIYDQSIKLKNSKTSKIFWGKVIDNNSVVVDL